MTTRRRVHAFVQRVVRAHRRVFRALWVAVRGRFPRPTDPRPEFTHGHGVRDMTLAELQADLDDRYRARRARQHDEGWLHRRRGRR